MSSVEITAGTVEPLHVYVQKAADGTALTGSTNLRVEIRRAADGYFYDHNDSAFKASGWTTKRGPLTEVSATDAPGWYRYSTGIDTTGWSTDSYFVTFLEITTSLAQGGPVFARGEIRIVVAPSLTLGTGAISATTFAAGAITSTVLADDAITSAKIAAGAITSSEAPALANLDVATSTLATAANLATVASSAASAATSAATAATRAADLQARTPAALTNGRTPAYVGEMAADVLTASALASSAVAEIQSGLADASTLTAVGGAIVALQADTDDIQARLPTTLSGGLMRSAVESMGADTLTSSAVAASAVAELQSGLATAASLTSVASAVTAVAADVDDLQTRLPAALVGGRVDASVGALGDNTVTASALAASAVTEIQTGLASAASLATVASVATEIGSDLDAIGLRIPALLVNGRMDSTVGEIQPNAITSSAVATSAVTEIQAGLATAAAQTSLASAVAALPTADAVAVAILDKPTAGHTTTGTVGAAIVAAASGADPTAIAAAVWAASTADPGDGTRGRELHRVYQLGFNRQSLTTAGSGTFTLYDDDATTELLTATVRDVGGGGVAIPATTPAQRGAAVEV